MMNHYSKVMTKEILGKHVFAYWLVFLSFAEYAKPTTSSK